MGVAILEELSDTSHVLVKSFALNTHVERAEFLASRMSILDKVIESSIASGQHSNAVGALKLQAELTRLLDR